MYREMYYRLFNRVTDAIALLRRMESVSALNLLMDAQREAEEMYLSAGGADEEESAT